MNRRLTLGTIHSPSLICLERGHILNQNYEKLPFPSHLHQLKNKKTELHF